MRRTQAVAFVLAQLVLVIALLSALDFLGDTYLFSAHMVQHLLLALPAWMVTPLFRWPVIAPVVRLVIAVMAFNLDMYAWHLALWNSDVLSPRFARAAILVAGLFEVAGMATIVGSVGLTFAIVMSILQEVWIVGAAIGLARRSGPVEREPDRVQGHSTMGRAG